MSKRHVIIEDEDVPHGLTLPCVVKVDGAEWLAISHVEEAYDHTLCNGEGGWFDLFTAVKVSGSDKRYTHAVQSPLPVYVIRVPRYPGR